MVRASPWLKVEYRWVRSEADRLQGRRLSEVGGKGLFVRAIEQAVLRREADLAVHSLKDMPADEPAAGLTLAAIPPRVDPRDALISAVAAGIDRLPQGARIGTASPRRAAQLLRRRPDVQIELLRGNVETRLRRVLEEKAFDATILAMAGLIRGGHDLTRIHPLEPSQMLPAAGQGALGVQCRADDHGTLMHVLALNDPATAQAVHAEREVVRQLGCDCHSAIGVLCELIEQRPLQLRVWLGSPDGRREATFTGEAPHKGLSHLVREAVTALKAQGAEELLKHTKAG